MLRLIFKYKFHLLALSFLIFFNSRFAFGGGIGNGSAGSPSISGIINTYASVLNINTTSCASSVTVLSAAGFSAGDLILIIQMEGAVINTSNTPSYGTILNYANAGNFEFIKVFSVTGNVIQTIAPLTNNYDVTGVIQLVRVPQYASPTISGVLTCPAWNGFTGGVIVLDATGTVTMNANIDATSRGFRGGQNNLNTGFPSHYGDYYLQDSDSGAYKGEGIASYFIAPNIYGRGAAANGGGGGNNHNAGGGGGSNAGCGGTGGYALNDPYYGPSYTSSQGIGGYALSNSGSPFKIFMGGGGGAGHQNDGSNATGGNGGGIIFISANAVNGNGRSVTAAGATSANVYRDGTGGGGAGGSVMINCSSATSLLNIDVHGGNGGSVTTGGAPNHGPGGGGGGGLVVFTSASLPANVNIVSINGGTGGICNGTNYGTANGCIGNTSFNLALPQQTQNPTVTTSSNTAFCVSGTITLNATPSNSYSWSPSAGLSCTNCQSPVATVNSTTVYVSTGYISSCMYIDSFTVQINPLPNVTLNPFTPVCVDGAPFPLSGGNPSGGNYFGTGVSSGNFDPSIAGPGTDTIFYTYTDANGCTDTTSKNITVNNLPVVIQSPLSDACIDAPSFALSGGNPAGGNYSGVGVTANNFNPAIAGSGLKTITYSYTDANGCSNTDSTSIKVNALPSVTLSAFTPVCVDANAFALSGGNPAGGTYSGLGVSSGNFDPAVAGVGTHAITYSYTDVNSCTNSRTKNLIVNALPNVTLNNFNPVCVNAPSFLLSGGNPAGGIFSGIGISANNFDASVAGIGSHNITYDYTDANGCSNNAAKNIFVNALPVVTLGAINPVCIAQSAFNLTTGNPAGGVYSGVGVSSGIFNPSVAGIGNSKIYYSYNDMNGCSNIDSTTITVYNLPNVIFSAVNPVCDGAAPFALTQGSPAGGTYSGVGVTGNNFNPLIAGIGTQTITYSYTDANGCGNSAQANITVNALPNVTLNNFNPVCVNAPSFALSGGNPSGGNFAGMGVSANNFDASIAGVGAHAITYNYTDGNGCSINATKNITVNALPVVTLGTINPVCIAQSPFALTTGNPAGGIYSGTGVNAGNFNSAVAGIGSHTIYYLYSDANGCSNIDSTSILVYDLPVVSFLTVNPVCEGDASFILTQGAPVSGTYSGIGIAGNNFDPLIAGVGTQTITYSYTDPNGCGNSAQTTITVNPLPVVILNSFNPVCVDAPSFALSGGNPAGGIYSGNGVSMSSFDPSVANVGTHQITYAYTDINGCSNYDSKNITVNPLIFLNAGADDTICSGESITLNVTGANNVLWNASPSLSCLNCIGPVANPTSNTIYIVSSPLPCSKYDTVIVNVVPAVVMDAGNDTTICFGESAQLNASSNYNSFNWSLSDDLSCTTCANPVASPLTATTYTVTGSNGICSASDEVTVNINHVIVDAGLDATIVNGEIIQLHVSGATSYIWSPSYLLNDSTAASPVAFPSVTTLYNVIGYTDGCSDTDSVVINVINIGDAIFIPSAFTPNGDGKNDVFKAERAGKYDSFEMKIFNRWGELVFVSDDINTGWDGIINGDKLQEGIYVYSIHLTAEKTNVTKNGTINLMR